MVDFSQSTKAGNSSYNAIVAGGDKTKQILLQKKEASFNYLTAKILKEQQQHKLSALYYQALYDWLLFAPSIMITLVSGILAILVKSTLVPSEKTQTIIALAIAILQVSSTFVQSLTKQLNYGGKAGFHNSAATSMKKIYEYATYSQKESKYQSIYKALKSGKRPTIGVNLADAVAVAQELQSEYDEEEKSEQKEGDVETPKTKPTSGSGKNAAKSAGDDAHAAGKDKKEGSMDSLTEQFHQAKDSVDSVVPIGISAAFNMLESRIIIINKSLMKDKKSAKISWEKVIPAAYLQLTETIIESKGWPMFIPDPKWSVEKALKDFKHSLRVGDDNSADLLKDIVRRAEFVSNDGYQLRDDDTPCLSKEGSYDDHSNADSTKPLSTV